MPRGDGEVLCGASVLGRPLRPIDDEHLDGSSSRLELQSELLVSFNVRPRAVTRPPGRNGSYSKGLALWTAGLNGRIIEFRTA